MPQQLARVRAWTLRRPRGADPADDNFWGVAAVGSTEARFRTREARAVNEHPGHASALYSVVLAGEVDDPDALVDLEDSYRAGEAVDIVIDLDEVTYLGAAGLQTLAVLCADAAERDGTVTVVRASEQVVKALKASGLDRLLVVADVPRQD